MKFDPPRAFGSPMYKMPEPAVQTPAQTQVRQYAAAAYNRLTNDWVANSTSADSEILTSIRALRNRGRQLVRDNDYARAAVRIIRNNVVGQGIGFQSQVMMQRGGKLDDKTNDAIEKAWKRWCKMATCSTSGKYSFHDIEKLAINALPESGEILVRMVRQPFGGGRIPFALEVIESDQVVENFTTGRGEDGNQIRMGVELDEWLRAQAYHLYPYHPGDYMFAGIQQTNRFIRVPARDVIHLGIAERPNQTRFVSWFASAAKRLNNIGGYEEAEIVAARASAAIMGIIQTPDLNDASIAQTDPNTGQRFTNLEAGTVKQLAPGEEFTGFTPNRPNAAMEPFLRFMLRAVAVGLGVNYAPLSGDYSQANYSSERAAQLNGRDEWRTLQTYFMQHFHQVIFENWLEMAVMSGELNLPGYHLDPEMYQAVTWQPRGWEWVDPLKDVMASKLAVRGGFDTISSVVAAKGGDVEEIFKTRRREIDLATRYDLVLETDPAQVDDKGASQKTDTASTEAATGDAPPADAGAADAAEKQLWRELENALARDDDARAMSIIAAIEHLEATLKAQPAPAAPIIHNNITVPEREAHFEVTLPEVRGGDTTIHTPPAEVVIVQPRRTEEVITRDAAGEIARITRTVTEE